MSNRDLHYWIRQWRAQADDASKADIAFEFRNWLTKGITGDEARALLAAISAKGYTSVRLTLTGGPNWEQRA